jgi:ceramide glucosyltransferase
MDWFFYIALLAIVTQLLSLFQSYCNYHYALSKYRKKRRSYQPSAVLIVPCRGLDEAFQKNVSSFFNLDYDDYSLWFVVADKSDPAYAQLCKLKEQLAQTSEAKDVQILIADHTQSCSQKIHNLLFCYERIGSDIEVLAFADSDVNVRTDWLRRLVDPLRLTKNGVATGYRWFIPKKNNLASLALSAINAKIAQMLGNSPFNQVWGGSMAIRVEVFRRLGIDKVWQNALSDDLSLSRVVKKAGLKVAFVPACLVASYQSVNWRELFEFGRRQLLITRINKPSTWWFGLLSSSISVLGLWVGAGIAIYTILENPQMQVLGAEFSALPVCVAVPVSFFVIQLLNAILRQKMANKLLQTERLRLNYATVADISAFGLWSLLLLFLTISSAFGRTIRWRGIRYKLLSPTKTIIIDG